MKALIFENKVVDLVEITFPTPETMSWMDAPEGCVAGEWLLVDGAIVPPPAPPEETYDIKRARAYPDLQEQLDMLFHDMTAGKGTKSGEWYKAVAKVKSDNPKPE